MSEDYLIKIIMHGMNVKEKYLSKINSLNDEIALLKYGKKVCKTNALIITQNAHCYT